MVIIEEIPHCVEIDLFKSEVKLITKCLTAHDFFIALLNETMIVCTQYKLKTIFRNFVSLDVHISYTNITF